MANDWARKVGQMLRQVAADTVPGFSSPPGRGRVLRTLKGSLLAATQLVGVYQRL